MKPMLKVSLLLAFVAFASTLSASGNLKVDIIPLSSEKVFVTISSVTDSKLEISVEDDLGHVLYCKEIAEPSGNYRGVFDFYDLASGYYRLIVKSDRLTTEREFEIRDWHIKVGDEITTIEPVFGYKDGVLKCSFLNYRNENLTLHFFNQNQLIYIREIGNKFNVSEAFKLSGLKKGTYTAVLLAGQKEYTYDVEVK